MTELKCSVTNCAFNEKLLCSLNNIDVGDASAVRKDETCCRSFSESAGNMTNSTGAGNPSIETEIRCDASECVYNTSNKCGASYIYVQNSGDKNGTRCDTFKAR